jgi:peptidoglycan/xylan/chitin deacetylase (PgdA/CDA1 family)/LysM repeat protein
MPRNESNGRLQATEFAVIFRKGACGGFGLMAPMLVIFLATITVSCDDGNGIEVTPPPSPLGSPTPSPLTTATPSPSARPPASSPTLTASPSPTPARTLTPTPVAGIRYTVQPGDTLYSVAERFGVSIDVIAQANGLSDPNYIFVGQVLVIPGVFTTPAPTPSTQAAVVVRRGDPTQMRVTFTFDAGSDAGYTSMILDILKGNSIRAAFGITGRWAERNPDLLRRIVAEGHDVINHSWDHPSFTGLSTGKPPLSKEERWEQLDRTESIVSDLVGTTTRPYFRPPYGDYDQSVNEDVGARGYRYNLMWTVDSRGWAGLSADDIVARCVNQAERGGIYVFHVGSASQDGPAVQRIIDGLRANGYEIAALSELVDD